MDIKPYDKTIRDLLGSKRQFVFRGFRENTLGIRRTIKNS